jgi:hypothetical protein
MAQQAQQAWTRSSWTDASQLVELIDPKRRVGDSPGHPPHVWFAKLVGDGKLMDALAFIAHALPRYECVVWATRALMELNAIDRNDPLVVAVLRWIDEPSDPLRRAAGELADANNDDSSARSLALAVLFSGGSLAPPEYAAVQPPADVCAKFAFSSVLSAALEQPDRNAAMRKALDLGEAMARGA